MRAAQLNAFGQAEDVLRLVNLPDPVVGPGQIRLEMLVATINPADLNVIEGKYGELPDLPAIIGNEGVGRVVELGAGVDNFALGDLALPMRPAAWCESMVVDASTALRLPPELDPFQAAMLFINPTSAWAMLEQFIELQPGDWIVQNAANSAVGRCVIQLAQIRGLKTLNVVRRPELVDELISLGADRVVLEGAELPRVSSLALNAVGGASALHLANALVDGGTLVTYGAMARQPLKIPNGLLIFRQLNFRGFWLKNWRSNTCQSEKQRIISELSSYVLSGQLIQPVHGVFSLSTLHAALCESAQEARSGKVLLDLQP